MFRRVLCVTASAAVSGFAAAPRVVRPATVRFSTEAAAPADFDISAIDIRVGTFVKAWHHPDSEKLFVEEIDMGEDEPRQIVSGLRAYYNEADLAGQRCLVVANLPKAKLGGVESFGMVLCGSEGEKEKVEFVVPPEGAENGERVSCEGFDGDALSSSQMKKKKAWPVVQPKLAVVDGVATYDGVPLLTSAGPCRPKTILNGPIS
ncbi:hypothetical protein M885DRAFT_520520 [Pelagophyceae sp. CCMP2097]|nr:hypothetical protein M885DRAFT_520520 [Pelagophyceae sp. CCMP2097]